MDGFLTAAAHGIEAGPLDPGRIVPESFGPMSGPVDAGALDLDAFDSHAFDLDGDGVVDSDVVHPGDAVVIVSDFDRDGSADRLTMIESDGDYASWECRRDAAGALVWEKIDAGAF